ncbi:MAG: ferritin-like domain-containing protein [Myxococcota bacterium]
MTTASDLRDTLPEKHPVQTENVRAAMDAIYNWNYEPEIDELRTLYANGLERQWIGLRDLDWEKGIDHESFTRTFSVGGLPITETQYWKNLPHDLKWQVARRSACFMLSNFLHGEQGALMVAGQLVNAVPDMDGKFYTATQTMDEARHVEVFAAYVDLLDEVYPISEGLKRLLDNVLSVDDWRLKAVGMQVVTEGLALYSFRDMRNQTEEPLLRQLLTYVSRDEARHTGFGIKYLGHVVPTLSETEKARIEDFAFEAARLLIDQRAGYSMRERIMKIWADAGIDPNEALGEMMKEREVIAKALAERGGRMGPISGFVIPTLRSIGLYSDRIAGHFREMWEANVGAEAAERMANSKAEIPEDLEAWVDEGAEAL